MKPTTYYHPSLLDFRGIARTTFSFLLELGYDLIECTPHKLRYRKDLMSPQIDYEYRSWELSFDITYDGCRYSLGQIMRCVDPAARKAYHGYTALTDATLREGLQHLADLVKQYCLPILRGDPAVLFKIDGLQKSWTFEDNLDDEYRRTLPKANEAFVLRHYRRAADLYRSVEPRLSPAERKKMAYAEAHSN